MLAVLLALAPRAALASTADAGGPYVVVAEDVVTFDGSGSDVEDCEAAWYGWDVDGDGTLDLSYSTDPEADYTASGYDGPDKIEVVLELKCRQSNAEERSVVTTTDSTTLEIENAAPEIDELSGPASVSEGELATFTVTWTDPEAADTVDVLWAFTDGYETTSSTVYRSFDDDGTYQAEVTVTDDDRGHDVEWLSIVVDNVPPEINTTPRSWVNAGDTYAVLPEADDPGADELTWSLEPVPDGATFDTGTGELSWSTTAEDAGTIDFTLGVEDDDGGSDTLEWTLEVRGGDTAAPPDTGGFDTGDDGAVGGDRDADWSGMSEESPTDGHPPGCGCSTPMLPRLLPLLLAGLAALRRRA